MENLVSLEISLAMILNAIMLSNRHYWPTFESWPSFDWFRTWISGEWKSNSIKLIQLSTGYPVELYQVTRINENAYPFDQVDRVHVPNWKQPMCVTFIDWHGSNEVGNIHRVFIECRWISCNIIGLKSENLFGWKVCRLKRVLVRKFFRSFWLPVHGRSS